MTDASTRLHGVEQLIDMEQYFVIHAARQSGRTTYPKDLTQRLNAGGKYYALYGSPETVRGEPDPRKGMPAIIGCLGKACIFSAIPNGDKFARQADLTDYVSVLEIVNPIVLSVI
jgi:hypothetical protein